MSNYTPTAPIDHGMFIMPFHDPDKPLGQCYDEDLELIILAEQLGFKEFCGLLIVATVLWRFPRLFASLIQDWADSVPEENE